MAEREITNPLPWVVAQIIPALLDRHRKGPIPATSAA
jgi:hypothetical protein